MLNYLEITEKDLNNKMKKSNIDDILNNTLTNNKTNMIETLSEKQNNFLDYSVFNCLKNAIGTVVEDAFPNFISETVSNLIDRLMGNKQEGSLLSKVADIISNMQMQTVGIGQNYENLDQVKNAINSCNIIGNISDELDKNVEQLTESKQIDNSISETLKNEKEKIVDTVAENIDSTFEKQMKDMEKLEKYMTNWKDKFDAKDFSGMEKEYKKMGKVIKSLFPIEKTLTDYRTIENLHTLIKNNGKNFDLSEQEIELANKLLVKSI